MLSRSAVTLALECGLADEAARLAREALDGDPPPDIAAELVGALARAEAGGLRRSPP